MTFPVLLGATAALLVLLGIRERRHRRTLLERDREIQRLQTAANDAQHDRTGGDSEIFFDRVAHELRSPLSAILGYQELLADDAYGSLDDRAREPVEQIGRSARHLLHLIDGVLDLGRLRSGSLRPALDTLDLGVLMSSVAEAFRVQAHERGLEGHVRMPDALPTVRSDRDRLIRTLDLLITSAVKHPADTRLTLEVSRQENTIAARITGIEIESDPDNTDPMASLGIRLAVARATARILGGQVLAPRDLEGTVRELELRIPTAQPAMEPS